MPIAPWPSSQTYLGWNTGISRECWSSDTRWSAGCRPLAWEEREGEAWLREGHRGSREGRAFAGSRISPWPQLQLGPGKTTQSCFATASATRVKLGLLPPPSMWRGAVAPCAPFATPPGAPPAGPLTTATQGSGFTPPRSQGSLEAGAGEVDLLARLPRAHNQRPQAVGALVELHPAAGRAHDDVMPLSVELGWGGQQEWHRLAASTDPSSPAAGRLCWPL